jgi:16S rRNA (uracil1498-N3)-methyltransferase
MPGHFTFYSHAIEGNKALFDENESRHALQVLRYGVGSHIEFTDGKGGIYKGIIAETGKKFFTADIIEINCPKNLPKLTLAIGTIKHTDRLEWLVEKACEFGVEALIFMQTENTVKQRLHTERLERIAISALKQSHNCRLPRMLSEDFKTVIEREAAHRFICHCRAEVKGQIGKFRELNGDTLVLIGPEGDFSFDEVSAAHRSGFHDLSLGAGILRTETAAMAVAAAYNLETAVN